jgi:hypothetical protein
MLEKTKSYQIENVEAYLSKKTQSSYADQVIELKIKGVPEKRRVPIKCIESLRIPISKLELLIGSYLIETEQEYSIEYEDLLVREFAFYEGIGSEYFKKCWIEPNGTLEEMHKRNKSNLKDYQKIYQIYHFDKNDVPMVKLKFFSGGELYCKANRLTKITNLQVNYLLFLEYSYVHVEYFKKGENIYHGTNRPSEDCRNDNVIIKNINLRIPYNLREREGKFLDNKRKSNHRPKQDDPIDELDRSPYKKYGGPHGYNDKTIDDAFGGDSSSTWNID